MLDKMPCPVTRDLDAYLNACDRGDAFDAAVDDEKRDLWKNLDHSLLSEAICNSDLEAEACHWQQLLHAVKEADRCIVFNGELAKETLRSLWAMVDTYLEGVAVHIVNKQIEDKAAAAEWQQSGESDYW